MPDPDPATDVEASQGIWINPSFGQLLYAGENQVQLKLIPRWLFDFFFPPTLQQHHLHPPRKPSEAEALDLKHPWCFKIVLCSQTPVAKVVPIHPPASPVPAPKHLPIVSSRYKCAVAQDQPSVTDGDQRRADQGPCPKSSTRSLGKLGPELSRIPLSGLTRVFGRAHRLAVLTKPIRWLFHLLHALFSISDPCLKVS